MKYYNNILEAIGNTPLVKINKLNESDSVILAKVESFNPMSSVKDRIAYAMITDAEDKGEIKPGDTLIEPTSGNTGIGLAMVSAVKGYRLILTMPDTMSLERRSLLKRLGAEIVLTPGSEGMTGAIKKAEELKNKIKNSYILQQFKNGANPEIHRKTTAEEIWKDTEGNIDIFVSGIGTGGTITGVGQILKQKKQDVKIIGVEPLNSAVLSGQSAGSHKIQGIGAGFIPEILDTEVIDEVITVKDEDAFETAKLLAREEGIFAGISSGAAMWAAVETAKKYSGKTIVVILPDTGERYLSVSALD